jgi:mannose-6-phosphate isomerase-like protein (cupin superfamily)
LLKSEDLHVIQEKMPAHSAEVMHYHRKSRQMFYMLHGELTMGTERESLQLSAGDAVVIEPPTPHQARNNSEEDVEFLVISCPPSHGDRFDCE